MSTRFRIAPGVLLGFCYLVGCGGPPDPCAGTAPSPALDDAPAEVKPLLHQCTELKKAGTPEACAPLLEAAIVANPDVIALHREYQNLLRGKGDTVTLRATYLARRDANPESALAQYLFGRAVLLESPAEADMALKRAIELDPGLLWGHLALGTLYSSKGDNFAAVQIYEAALERFPTSSEVLFNLANSRRALGTLRTAQEAVQKAVCLRPDYAEAYELLGITQYEQDDLTLARGNLEKAASLRADMPNTQLHLAWIAARSGELEKGRQYLAAAEKLGANVPFALREKLTAPATP